MQRIHLPFEIRAAIQQLFRKRLIVRRSAMGRSSDPNVREQQAI